MEVREFGDVVHIMVNGSQACWNKTHLLLILSLSRWYRQLDSKCSKHEPGAGLVPKRSVTSQFSPRDALLPFPPAKFSFFRLINDFKSISCQCAS